MEYFEDEAYDNLLEEKEETIEDEDELSTAEEGFLKGYEEDIEDPVEEVIAEEELE